jgi:hypothetical protein
MARYLVEEEGANRGESGERESADGLAVAKALARKKSQKSSSPVVVRDSTSGKVVARYVPPAANTKDAPTLANSVERMKAANDRLKEALVPPATAPGRKKRA